MYRVSLIQRWGLLHLCSYQLLIQFSTKNLIVHELWKLSNFGQTFKVSTARVRWYFLLKVGTLRAKGIRKNALILFVGGSAPTPPTRLEIRVRIGKDTCPGCVDNSEPPLSTIAHFWQNPSPWHLYVFYGWLQSCINFEEVNFKLIVLIFILYVKRVKPKK